jgi:hypothetical protein
MADQQSLEDKIQQTHGESENELGFSKDFDRI